MAAIKDTSRSAEKWKRRTETAGPEYEEGVRNPRSDWAEKTAEAESNFEQGIQAAISKKSFGKGVRKTGTEGWQRAALEKGPTRFAQGVSGAADKYRDGFQPYADTIKNLNLPARGPKGDPKNIARVAMVAKALHDKKVEMQAR